jgi:hypothetical protein
LSLTFPLPDSIEKRVSESVRRFEDRLQTVPFAEQLAKANGWVEEFRNEVEAVAREAYFEGAAANVELETQEARTYPLRTSDSAPKSAKE